MIRLLLVLFLLLPAPAYAIEMIGFGAAGGGCGTGTKILGTDSIGASTFNSGIVGRVYFYTWTASATGLVCTGEAYFTEAVTEPVKMLVYNSSDTLIATSTAISSTTANEWNVFTFDGSVSLTSGQSYSIGWIHGATNYEPGIRHNGQAWLLQRDATGTYASPPTDISGHESEDETLGIPSLRIKN